jgi:hypothetical protein
LTIVAIGVGLVYVMQFAEFMDVMYNILYERNTAIASAKNASGDKAIVTTNLWDAPDDPLKTVIRLKVIAHPLPMPDGRAPRI